MKDSIFLPVLTLTMCLLALQITGLLPKIKDALTKSFKPDSVYSLEIQREQIKRMSEVKKQQNNLMRERQTKLRDFQNSSFRVGLRR